MTLQPDRVITPFGRLVSPATSLFERPYGCTLLFAPEADLVQLEAALGLVLPTDENGWRRLDLTAERRPAVLGPSKLPVVTAAEVSKDPWARALVQTTVPGTIEFWALQLVPEWTESPTIVRSCGDASVPLPAMKP